MIKFQDTRLYRIDTHWGHHQIFYLKNKNTCKVALKCLFTVFVLLNSVKLYYKQVIDQKMCTFKNLDKTCKK